MSRSSTTKRSNTTEPSTFGKSFSVKCGEVLQDGYKLLVITARTRVSVERR